MDNREAGPPPNLLVHIPMEGKGLHNSRTGMASPYLDRPEVLHFAETNLAMDDPERHLAWDNLGFLRDFTRAFHNRLPFHNVTLLSSPSNTRHVTSVENNVRAVLQGHGGLCWTLNSVMYLMLRALGYDVISVLASVSEEGTKDHVITIARSVQQDGDSYLVDVGFGYPTFEVVALDFERQSETFEESFARYHLVRRDDGVYIRYNESRRPEVEEQPAYYFRNEYCDLDTMEDFLEKTVYTAMGCIFHTSLRLVRFVDSRCVAIKDDVLLLEGEDGKLVPTPLTSVKVIMAAVRKYFPEIPEASIPDALRHWAERRAECALLGPSK